MLHCKSQLNSGLLAHFDASEKLAQSSDASPYGIRELQLHPSNIVVPPPCSTPVMKMLHEGHPGVSRMKCLVKGVDNDWMLTKGEILQVFVVHGLPEVLVSDNGAAFTSADFQTFVERNGFRKSEVSLPLSMDWLNA
eukprot:Em0008g871a